MIVELPMAIQPISLDAQASRSRSKELKDASRNLVKQTSMLVDRAREIRSKSTELLSSPHGHQCMSCKAHWTCKTEACELKYLSLCFVCHRKLGSW
jgi:hypothetical protein